jgi:hypothetical protein
MTSITECTAEVAHLKIVMSRLNVCLIPPVAHVPIGNRQNVVVHMVVLRTPFGEDTIALAHQQDVPEPLNVNMIPLAVNVQ